MPTMAVDAEVLVVDQLLDEQWRARPRGRYPWPNRFWHLTRGLGWSASAARSADAVFLSCAGEWLAMSVDGQALPFVGPELWGLLKILISNQPP